MSCIHYTNGTYDADCKVCIARNREKHDKGIGDVTHVVHIADLYSEIELAQMDHGYNRAGSICGVKR